MKNSVCVVGRSRFLETVRAYENDEGAARRTERWTVILAGDRDIENASLFFVRRLERTFFGSWIRNVVALNLFHTRLLDPTGLSSLVSLESLNLSRTRVGARPIALATELKPLIRLLDLQLNGVSLGNFDFLAALSAAPRLQKLGLACTLATDEAVRTIGANLPSLRELDLYNTAVSVVEPLLSLSFLVDLDLERTAVSERAARWALRRTASLRNGTLAVNFGEPGDEFQTTIRCAAHRCLQIATNACSGCNRAFYCSETCQVTHWNDAHRDECL